MKDGGILANALMGNGTFLLFLDAPPKRYNAGFKCTLLAGALLQSRSFITHEDMVLQKPLVRADQAVLMAAFGRIDVVALAIAMGTVFAVVLFLLTVTLLLKGAPPGMRVGPHLALLGIYLPGYTVSGGGSVIGSVYAWIIGASIGFVWAVLWNFSHYLYILMVVIRDRWWRLMGD